MKILAPRVAGPLSECNRYVRVTNALSGSVVTIVVTRGGARHPVGSATVNQGTWDIPLNAGDDLQAGDIVNASQTLGPDTSADSLDGPIVQTSVAQFDAPQVLTNLFRCSRGFFLGGMRPGTEVQILQGGTTIGTGVAHDGTASITVPNGLPAAAAGALVARQLICPKPPPPTPGSKWAHDSPLPEVLPLPFTHGMAIPAPRVAEGLHACSRAVRLTDIQPGADVVLEGKDTGWWVARGSSDQREAWVALPVSLREGETVAIRQEVAIPCELTSEVQILLVGPPVRLAKPVLSAIACSTVPTLAASGLKPEADVEFEVIEVGGAAEFYRTTAGQDATLPAPPTPAGASVMVRQGECGMWSDWSAPQTAPALAKPPAKPKISHRPYACQDAIPVHGISPVGGLLVVMGSVRGELNRVPVTAGAMVVSVAPSLHQGERIAVEHHICGNVARSDESEVMSARDVGAGMIKVPVYEGDTTVTVQQVAAGARMELWESASNAMLSRVRSPFHDSGHTDVTFTGLNLQGRWLLIAKTFHCAHFPQTKPPAFVSFRAPTLSSLSPSSVLAGASALTVTAKGQHFRSGAKGRFNGADRQTTFTSATEVRLAIPASDVATAKNVPIQIVNPDGQASGNISFIVTSPAPAVVGYDEFVIQNCNTNFLTGSAVHRPIHIYYRLANQNPPDVWIPIWDSPHNADYDAAGQCPSGPNAGARFAMDDGKAYEVVCTDPLLAGCISGGPDEPACRRSQVFVVRGKAGGGVKTVIVN